MDPSQRSQLRSYIESLDERGLQSLIYRFFFEVHKLAPKIIHGQGEHGIDIIVHTDDPILGTGYNILVQVKRGDVTPRDIHEVFGQLLEGTYYPYTQVPFDVRHPRRVILIVSGKLTSEASQSLDQFNKHHGIMIEYFEIDQLVDLFENQGFANTLLDEIAEIGQPLQDDSSQIPPEVGDENAPSFD